MMAILRIASAVVEILTSGIRPVLGGFVDKVVGA
jgi:hypothetical protein